MSLLEGADYMRDCLQKYHVEDPNGILDRTLNWVDLQSAVIKAPSLVYLSDVREDANKAVEDTLGILPQIPFDGGVFRIFDVFRLKATDKMNELARAAFLEFAHGMMSYSLHAERNCDDLRTRFELNLPEEKLTTRASKTSKLHGQFGSFEP